MDPVIVVSGRIASGKTTFARNLAKALGVSCVGFGDEVRARLSRAGGVETREALQALGAQLVATDPDEFCRAVLARGGYQPGQGLVIEGVRHFEILERLRFLLSPQRVQHVHVQSLEIVRQSRLEERARVGELGLAMADQHSTEIQLGERLPASADIRVDGLLEEAAMVKNVVQWISG